MLAKNAMKKFVGEAVAASFLYVSVEPVAWLNEET